MQILKDPMDVKALSVLAQNLFGDMVKAVVDIKRDQIALDATLHADLEHLLLENGSALENLWGINLFPGLPEEDFIEFESLINIRPLQNNNSLIVKNEATRQAIRKVVNKWITC